MTTKRTPAPRRQPGAKPPVKSPKKPPSRLGMLLSSEKAIIGISLIATVVLIIVIAVASGNNNANRSQVVEGVETFPIVSGNHVQTPVNYAQTPPAGGPHHPVWQTCGVYTEPLISEHAVHSLEHGAVWITYQPELAADQVETLASLVRRGSHRLLSPFPSLDSPIVLSAWGIQLRVDSADDPRVQAFISKYEQGEQTPELGASCSGGITDTASSGA